MALVFQIARIAKIRKKLKSHDGFWRYRQNRTAEKVLLDQVKDKIKKRETKQGRIEVVPEERKYNEREENKKRISKIRALLTDEDKKA